MKLTIRQLRKVVRESILRESQEIDGWQSLSQAIGQEGAENLEQTFIEENEQATDVDRYESACENYIKNIWTFKDNQAAVAFAMSRMGDFWSNDEGGYDDDDGYYY